MLELLLDNGADVNHINDAGESALLISCYENNQASVKLLVKNGADIFVSSKSGLSPIWYSCSNNQKEIVGLFLDNGLDVNYAKPITAADGAMNSYLDWIESAADSSLGSNFSLNNEICSGESLLQAAVKNGYLSMVKLLIERDAKVNYQDESGNTALHYAAANGKKDIVKYLLENNADVNVVNVKEQKAIDYSNIKGYNEITELILKFSAPGTVVKPVASQVAVTEAPKNDMAIKKQALMDLKELFDAGILNQEEFDTEKLRILKG